MTDNRTTELLREGLTKHGIEWRSGLEGVTFVGDWCFVEYDNGKLAATCEPVLTPEQAIAATLWSDVHAGRFAETLHDLAEEMRNIGASSMTPHELLAFFAREIDKVADSFVLAATLGSGECECESSLLWDCYHGRDFYEHRLSCGHIVTSDFGEPPNYCGECGAKVRKAVKR